MNEKRSSTGRSLVWLSSDPLIDDPSYRKSIFNLLSGFPNREPILLPSETDKNRQIHFNKFVADKITPDVTVYELSQKENFTWLTAVFPFPLIAAMMILYDPRKGLSKEVGSLANLSEDKFKATTVRRTMSQKRYLHSCFNLILAYLDLPPILLYLRDTEESLSLEQLVGVNMLPNMNVLSYHIDKLDNLASDLSDLLKTL